MGSRFELCLSLLTAELTGKHKTRRAPNSALGQRALHILVVEDDTATRLVVQRFLEDLGHHVSLASDGYRAIALAKREMPDLVMMDISLPGMDGIATAAQLRAATTGKNLPIVAMSAHVFTDEVEHYLASGMDGYVAKPLTPERIAQTQVGVARTSAIAKRVLEGVPNTGLTIGGFLGTSTVAVNIAQQHLQLQKQRREGLGHQSNCSSADCGLPPVFDGLEWQW